MPTIKLSEDALNRVDVDGVMAAMTDGDNEPGRVRGVDLFRVRGAKVAEKLVHVKG